MIRIQLPQTEVEKLETLFRSPRSIASSATLSRLSCWHTAVARTRTSPPTSALTAEAFSVGSTPTLTGARWAATTQGQGADGNFPAEMAEEIKHWVIEGPARQGLNRANWTHAEMVDHLLKTHGISTSRSAMHRFFSRIGIRPYRPTYRYLRGNPDK